MNRPGLRFLVVTTLLVMDATRVRSQDPFAAFVVEYSPAPGQFVNAGGFDDPARALGPPVGGGIAQPDNSSIVSLGGFGGFIVLGFGHTVLDDPRNRFGMDAIVFGNAHWVGGNPTRHWAECVTIEIGLDANGNGFADDPWFLIPGSHIPVPASQLHSVIWDDNTDDPTYPPEDEEWLTSTMTGRWMTEGFALPAQPFGDVILVNPSQSAQWEAVFGYGDYAPTLILGDLDADNVVDDPTMTAKAFYTWPDDPSTVGMSPHAGGGDAFDIRWAVDPLTQDAANLPGFDFIRLTTAVESVSPIFGEKSGEIDAVADIRPDPWGDVDEDDDIDLWDVAVLQRCFGEAPLGEECELVDLGGDQAIEHEDAGTLFSRMTGP